MADRPVSHAHPTHVSVVLAELASQPGRERVTMGDLLDSLQGRAFGVLMILFAVPNIVGVGAVPGVSTLFGAPQMVFALQMIAGAGRPWLPKRLLGASMAQADLQRMVERFRPRLERLERLLRPRLVWLTSPFAERLLGVAFLALATVVALPIPLANNLPSVAMAVIALGIIAFDGLFVLAGLVLGAVSLVVAVLVVGGGIYAVWKAISLF